MEPWAISIRDKIISHPDKWTPLLPEFKIYDEELRLGTQVDMICMNAKGKVVLLEFKVGYAGYFALNHPKRFFSGP